MNLIYVVVLAVSFGVGAVAGYIKYRFFEPASVPCTPVSTDERCVRARKIVEKVMAMTPEERKELRDKGPKRRMPFKE